MRIGIIGATGRLGRAIGALALNDPKFQITAALTHPNSPHLHLDYGTFLHFLPLNVPISTTAKDVDLLIDVSLSSVLEQNLSFALILKKPIVIGTTGLSDADFQLLKKTSQQIPIFYTPNFSLGMALLHKFAQEVSRHFPSAEIDLIETHHSKKKDAPSGSALSLAKAISSAIPRIHSIRSGQIIGEHELRFNTSEERLTLSHQAHSRDAFARGALASAHFLLQQAPGLYGMEDLIKEFARDRPKKEF